MSILWSPRIAAACGVGVLLFGASACGNSDPDDSATTTGPGATTSADPDAANRQAFPGADGEVAAVDGNTAQVQNRMNGQVAVTWNDATTFTKQVSASLEDVEAGVCVMVQPARDGGDRSSEDDAGTTTVAAATVRITEKEDGSCAGGLRGGPAPAPGAGGGPDRSQEGPGDGPPDGPPDGARPQVRAFGGAFGEVTALTDGGFTVTSTMPRFEEGSETPSMEEVTVTVTVSGATTYTTTGAGSAADVKTGTCLRAEGEADETGAITARTIAISPATDGECGATFLRSGEAPAPGGPAVSKES